jgi:hypothetical protein
MHRKLSIFFHLHCIHTMAFTMNMRTALQSVMVMTINNPLDRELHHDCLKIALNCNQAHDENCILKTEKDLSRSCYKQ